MWKWHRGTSTLSGFLTNWLSQNLTSNLLFNPPACRRVLWMLLVTCICFMFRCNLSLGADFYDPPLPPSPPYFISYYENKKIQDIDVADRPAMFSLTPCLAPAFCFLFRMVLSIVKRHSLISRRVLWMSFVSAYVWCCLIHTCQPLVLLHSLPLRPFPLLFSYGIIYSLISSGIISRLLPP